MVGIRQIAYVLNAKIKRRSVPLRICKAHYINVEHVKKTKSLSLKNAMISPKHSCYIQEYSTLAGSFILKATTKCGNLVAHAHARVTWFLFLIEELSERLQKS